ncbi:MAG: hypothetical protein ACTSRI_17735 [Promethearchaeota archaeon]
MDLHTDYDNFQIHAFWSKEIMALIDEITTQPGKSYSTQHDIILRFVNDTLFQGRGEFNREFRKKGKTYPDLKIPVKETNKGFEVVELRVHTSQLKYLRGELRIREKTFSTSDRLYFTYLLQVGLKEEGKVLLDRACIYYLVIIKLLKKTRTIPINELAEEIRMGTKEFTEKLAEKSGIDGEKEELLGVENIIKVIDLERKLNVKIAELDQKDKEIEQKGKQLDQKDKEIEQKDKEIEQKDKEIERLKAQLKDK